MAQHYRVILLEGDQAWIDKTLDQSIRGVKRIGANSIIAADISPVDARSIWFFRNIVRQLEATATVDSDADNDEEKGFD